MEERSEKIEVIPEGPSGEDLQEYITWVLTQDASKNPLNDFTGERSSRNQGRSDVWFIPGTTTHKGTITRTCDVPSNREIVILAATSDSSYLEHGDAKNDAQLLEIAMKVAKLHKDILIKIADDKGGWVRFEVADASNQEGESKLIKRNAFPIIIPESNIYRQLYSVRGGYTHLAVVAFGIKVKLKPGKYELIMQAHHDGTSEPLEVDSVKVDAPPFNLDIKYDLNAREEKEVSLASSKYSE